MVIGINATAAFKEPRTGVEEYTYQLIKHLTMLEENTRHRFILYTQSNFQFSIFNFQLPKNFFIKKLDWPLPMWTQMRLATDMVINKPEVLFIPVHVLPLIHPQNSVVTIHGLEYEHYPEMYPWRHLKYLQWSTKYALKKARKIIAVSENTKKDLINLYKVEPEKIEVIYHGVEIPNSKFQIPNKSQITKYKNYILFIGRLELKKNIVGLLEAYRILKERYKVPHDLVLVGPPGYSYNRIKLKIENLLKIDNCKLKIKELGFIPEEEKQELLANADIFLLPSFYEGFGIPILEAQAAGCPIITSNVSSMPEVAGQGAVLINPKNIEEIAEAMYKIISDGKLRKDLIAKGYQNVKRFSWQKCAQQTLKILTEL